MNCGKCGRTLGGSYGPTRQGEVVWCEMCAAKYLDGRVVNEDYYKLVEVGDIMLKYIGDMKESVKRSVNFYKYTDKSCKIVIRDIACNMSSVFMNMMIDVAKTLKKEA